MTSGHPFAAPPGVPRDAAALGDSYAPICRNVRIAGRRTSVRMERVMWVSLYEICEREGMSVNEICTLINRRRGEGGLTAALRVFIISYFRELMRLDRTLHRPPPPHGHRPAGDRALLSAALTVFGPRSG